ncbi:siderophore-interacting protein [Hahella aquimaris]|uniref:siderophore-interacting protein n=1 Tax=Hahella sp. HNIBRBA332 TaxID=3015983 RepID=UPI00273A9DCE|nr:siderophore-interacting protein [Hahella sp. HNIBRBA332]WLQ16282.1 siderophore-interacting protein [Hahella sp. HNIBRBA332]
MSRPAPRELTLVRRQSITPNMLRVTLGGDGIANFPADQESAYVKLMFPRDGEQRPLMRTYTVRAQREDEIDIDFVIHEDGGPASTWAIQAEIGSQILIGGPGPKKLVDADADWFLVIGDMTALPAISVNLEQLPSNARGYVVIEVISEADIQPLKTPANLDVHWLINPHPGVDSNLLLNKVRDLPWLQGRPSVWCACELNSMRQLRDHFRAQEGLQKSDLYISSYWKLGVSEDEHKVLKAALN